MGDQSDEPCHRPGDQTAGDAIPDRPKRHRVVQQGRIVVGTTLVACVIRDLSRTGAKVRVSPETTLPDRFDLVIAAHDLRTVAVRLRWRRGEFVGVTFVPSGGS